ncbi:hypothetical protein ABW20_dc0107469 [Dactylellina cionopaga]|nr:hypothetical protein ABW20_dc0107469 [Dactylellina cionopaga]
MTEVLGAVASSLQLIEVAIGVGSKIYKFVDSIKSAPKKVLAFRRNLEQTLTLLEDTGKTLEIAKVEYQRVGDTASLVESTVKEFYQELADISISVETVYANSKRWRNKIRIGLKGDGEWERFDGRIKTQFNKLTAVSVQLSKKLILENGTRIIEVKAEIQAVGFEIIDNVSAPVQEIQRDVSAIRNTGDTSILLLQESIAMQMSNMQRTELLHDHQFQRITEIKDTVSTNQNETVKSLTTIENSCAAIVVRQENQAQDINDLGGKLGNMTGVVQKLADDLSANNGLVTLNITTQSNAVLKQLGALAVAHKDATTRKSTPKSNDDVLRLERQKDNLSFAVRQILRLAEDSSKPKLMKGSDAKDCLTAVRQLLETLQDDSEDGQNLKYELSLIATQLLGTKSLYTQRSPDASLQNRLESAETHCESMVSAIDAETTENKLVRKVQELDEGTLIISSRTHKRIADDESEVLSNRATIIFKPHVKVGESAVSWIASSSNIAGTEGNFSVPLLIRVHNRRFYAPMDKTSPQWLTVRGNLEGLKALFSSGQASIYDVNQNGSSLLHHAISSLQSYNHPGRAENEAQRCFKVCKFLLDQGADANILDDKGRTPLNGIKGIIFNRKPSSSSPDIKIAQLAFYQVLESSIDNRASPFGPEQAIASLVRSLISGSSYFLDLLLLRLNDTEFDINCYSGFNNAIMLEFCTVPNIDHSSFMTNCNVAVRHGGDINARTWYTQESCLHLLLKSIQLEPGDLWVKSEANWVSYKASLVKILSRRLRTMLSLGADIYSKDEKYLEFSDGRNINCTITRDMYAHEVQDTWWECLAEFGHSKSEVIYQEARDLEASKDEYEAYLNSLAKNTFEKRQKMF